MAEPVDDSLDLLRVDGHVNLSLSQLYRAAADPRATQAERDIIVDVLQLRWHLDRGG